MSSTTTPRPIRRLLIANRGEIACRIIRSARALGIVTIAVYSEADHDAPHVRLADEAHLLGPSEAKASYLDQDKVLVIARAARADAVHPGYGFLSENAGFAERCQTEGLIFVGPPPAATRAMGEKAQAKALMEPAGVPLVPGYHGDGQGVELLRDAASRIGYPVLIKASAGGGGKGMKVVESAEEFDAALTSAQREAMAAFGDDRVLIEKYLKKPRHVEVQVFADIHGACLHLYDRDCSVQRRHQKVIEEAPAPGIPQAVRDKMHAAAVSAAKAIDYVGAGTIEFLYDEGPQKFYFMEMNTRLQVEHPVTEAITGLDLVAWQLLVAAGGALPLTQDEVKARGHAIEVRLYAEDPERDFLPQTGRITRLVTPEGDGIRVDSGVTEGFGVSVYYDPMLAKIIATGPDRAAALARLSQALSKSHIGGVVTNIGFLERILHHPEFQTGAPDTGFIPRNWDDLQPQAVPAESALVAAAAGLLLKRQSAGGSDPWQSTSGWRLNAEPCEVICLGDDRVTARRGRDGLRLAVADGAFRRVSGTLTGNDLLLSIDGVTRHGLWLSEGNAVTVTSADGRTRFALESAAVGFDEGDMAGGDVIRAPMPGRVTALMVSVGDNVAAGETLLVVEAMKMENALKAPRSGRIAAIHCAVGEQVEEKAELVVLEGEE